MVRVAEFIKILLLLALFAACSQEPNEDEAVEVTCLNSSHTWVVETITCDGAAPSGVPSLEISYQVGPDIIFRKGDKQCFEEITWNLIQNDGEAEANYFAVSGRRCFANSKNNPVTSCSSGSFSCTQTSEVISTSNNFRSCAITSDKMYMERYVSTSAADAGLNLCPAGETEKLTLIKGTLQSQPTLDPVVASRFVIIDPSDSMAGVAATVQVEAQDGSGNVATTFNDDVTLLVDGSATGAGVIDIVNGIGTLNINDTVAETINLSLSDHAGTGLNVSSTQDLLFVPGLPDHLLFNQQPSTTNSNQNIAPTISVEIYDSYNNLVTYANNSITLSFQSDPSLGIATLAGTTSLAAVSGVATFADLRVDYADTGYTLNASASGLTGATSASFDILPTGSITVSAISQNTDETGTQGTFTVVLDTAPLADVTIAISSSDTSEGLPDQSSLTFTSANWSSAQTVTVTGQSDSIADGNIGYSIVTGVASSADSNYNAVDPADVSLINIDSAATPGLTVSGLSGPTSEQGATATFTVALNTQPTSDVIFNLSESDSSEVSIDKNSLIFTNSNWATPQVVTLTGVNDSQIDGDQVFTIITSLTTSLDGNYSGLNPNDVTGVNLDDDSVGIQVTDVNSNTTEEGDTAQFSIRLLSPPTSNVTIPLTSSDPSEGSLAISNLVFTPANWMTPQIVVITGVDDLLSDGDQSYFIDVGSSSSADTNYNGINPPNVFLQNLDNDSPGILVSELSGNTLETGTQESLTIRLTSPPTGDVDIDLSVSDSSEASVSPNTLTFTSANWMIEQTVIVTGLDDTIADGPQSVDLVIDPAISADLNYNGIDASDVSFLNLDDDTIGFNISPIAGLNTNESGSQTQFSVSLKSPPTDDVTLTFSNGDSSEIGLSTTSLVFTDQNWMVPQQVVVTGVDDAIQDGSVMVTITTNPVTSADPDYNGENPQNIIVTNFDNDTPGILVTPDTGNLSRLQVHEYGSEVELSFVLASQPTAQVTINLSSRDPSEGRLSVGGVVFTPDNWNSPQKVLAYGVDDPVKDGPKEWEIRFNPTNSADPNYSGLSLDDVYLVTLDDDDPGVTLSPNTSDNSAFVFESGGSTDFTVVLNSQPSADVTISFSPDDTSESSMAVSSIVFTPENWNVPKSVAVYGVDDGLFDGNRSANISVSATSTDNNYDGIAIAPFQVTCVDDETSTFAVTPTTSAAAPAVTSESGGTAFVDIALSSQPAFNVQLSFSSDDTNEGITDITQLTFTPQNWNEPKRIWITGVDDLNQDGDKAYKIIFNNATSLDLGYAGKSPPDISLINLDND